MITSRHIGLAVGLALLGAPAPDVCAADDFPAFELHEVDAIGRQLGQTALVDVDRDGDLDWIAGQADRAGGQIWWWEFRGWDEWRRHLLGVGHTDVGGAAHDVDGDGWVDFLSGSRLLLNPGAPREREFTPHDVGTTYSHDTGFADVDGDGRLDAIANWDEAGLFWYAIPEDVTAPWRAHTIASAEDHEVHAGVSPRAVGDLDGDGDADVVTARVWYENTGGGAGWRPHPGIDLGEVHRYGLAVRTWVADMDADGDLDFVQSEADNPDGRVAWFENDGRGRFARHLIQDHGERQDFHSLAVADFDGDGDLDVFSAGGPLSAEGTWRCFVWERAGETWRRHVIAERPCHEAVAGDVEGDGDVDVLCKPWSTGDRHFALRNTLVESRR